MLVPLPLETELVLLPRQPASVPRQTALEMTTPDPKRQAGGRRSPMCSAPYQQITFTRSRSHQRLQRLTGTSQSARGP